MCCLRYNREDTRYIFWAVSIVVVQCIRIARTGVRFPHGPPSINLSDRQSKLAHQYKRLDTLKGKYESR